ncbi:MAG: type IV pilus twitching motility protein PilT [Myxococcales bacterium]|nr:type IV pilus twitching motility protein PilT [Myxococcales bacterium]
MPRIDNFLRLMQERGASDLHFVVGQPPCFRLSGSIDPIRYKSLSNADFDVFLGEITPKHIWQHFKDGGDADYAYECPGLARFRVNLFKQERGAGAVFRIIPTKLLTMEQLGLPDACQKIVTMERGLCLVTGPTGSGKSTTLSAIINKMNETRKLHIITIEDPIEFVHPNKQSLITQREVGASATSFAAGLRAALREDPDIVLVGEMRDLETIQLALSAAETGLLVFGTLHTNSAAKTVDRIINVFPTDEQESVRGIISDTLSCVLAQQLLKRKKGGRVAALEILFGSPAMGNIIREGKTHQLTNLIRGGKAKGMVTMDDSLERLVKEDVISAEAAYEKSIDKKEFRKRMMMLGHNVGAADEDPEETEKLMNEVLGVGKS